MKKIHVPQCRINENLFIIDSTPTEDAADNRFGLNSENPTSRQSLFWQLHSSASWWSHVVLGSGTVKIFVAPKPFLSVLTISLGVGSIMNNIYIWPYDNFTPHIPYFPFYLISTIIICHTSALSGHCTPAPPGGHVSY